MRTVSGCRVRLRGKAATMHRRKVPARVPCPVLVGGSGPAAGHRRRPRGALFLTTHQVAARFAPLVRRPRRSAITLPPGEPRVPLETASEPIRTKSGIQEFYDDP